MWILFTDSYQILGSIIQSCLWASAPQKNPETRRSTSTPDLVSCKKQLLSVHQLLFFSRLFSFCSEAFDLQKFLQKVNWKGKTTYLRSGKLGQKKREKNRKKQISKNDWNNKITCYLVAFFSTPLNLITAVAFLECLFPLESAVCSWRSFWQMIFLTWHICPPFISEGVSGTTWCSSLLQ